MTATLNELATKYRHAVFTAKRLIDMADEAKADGLPEAHDVLIAAGEYYTKSFEAIRTETLKAFPGDALKALAFDTTSIKYSQPDDPKA